MNLIPRKPIQTQSNLFSMSRARITYTVCYVLMMLCLVAFPFIMKATEEWTPRQHWSLFQSWIGPVPQQLQAEEWRRESDDRAGIIFTFRADDDWRERLVHHFALADKERGAAPLPAHWEAQISPTQPKLTAYTKLMISDDGEYGFEVQDMTLAQLSDGRTLLAFRHKSENDFCGRMVVPPAYPRAEAEPTPTWRSVLWGIALIAFSQLAPLGFLLLFPSFNLNSKRHVAYWFTPAALFPLIPGLLMCLSYEHYMALLALLIGSIVIIPLQLAGAGILLPLVRMIAFRSRQTEPEP